MRNTTLRSVWWVDVSLWHLAGLLPVRNARYRQLAAVVEDLRLRADEYDRILVSVLDQLSERVAEMTAGLREPDDASRPPLWLVGSEGTADG